MPVKKLSNLLSNLLCCDLEDLKMHLEDAYECEREQDELIQTLRQQLTKTDKVIADNIELQKRVRYLENLALLDLEAARTLFPDAHSVGSMATIISSKLRQLESKDNNDNL